MKKVFSITLATGLLFCSCTQETGIHKDNAPKMVEASFSVENDDTRTTIDSENKATLWQNGDIVAVYIGTKEGDLKRYDFTASVAGQLTYFNGSIDESWIGQSTRFAAIYPSNENTFDGETFTIVDTDSDILYSLPATCTVEAAESGAEIKSYMNFKPLMARIHVSLNSSLTSFLLTADDDVFPTAGTIDSQGNFTASAHTNTVAVETSQKEFDITIMPVKQKSTIETTFRNGDNWPMTGKTFSCSALRSNTYYSLTIGDATTKPYVLNVSEAIDAAYGTNTADAGAGIFDVSDADTDGIFAGWKFYFAELKMAGNNSGRDILTEDNRIQLQTNNDIPGAFCTAPIYFADESDVTATQKVRIYFWGATNNILSTTIMPLKCIIGGLKKDIDITPENITNRDNFDPVQDCNIIYNRSRSYDFEFTITNGQRIAFAVQSSTSVGSHIELSDFTIEFVD